MQRSQSELGWMNSVKWSLTRPLWILWTCYRVSFCLSGEGTALWSLCGHQAFTPFLLSATVSVSKWVWHRPETYPAEVLWNQRPLKWTSACVQWVPPETLSHPRSPNVVCSTKTLWTPPGRWAVPLPPTPWPYKPPPPREPEQFMKTKEQTTLGWSATPAYTCHKT